MEYETYEKSARIFPPDADTLGRARPSTLARLMQEIAGEHAEYIGVGSEAMQEKNALWVLVRTVMEITRLPKAWEEVKIITRPNPIRHGFCPRQYRLETPEGELLVKACSLWMMMDADSRKMVSPEKVGLGYPGSVGEDDVPPPFRSQRLPELKDTGESRTVRYTELDTNRHLNNVRYLDYADDLLSPDFHESHRLRSLWAEYRKENRWGQTIAFQAEQQENTILLRGLTDGQETFTLREDYDTL